MKICQHCNKENNKPLNIAKNDNEQTAWQCNECKKWTIDKKKNQQLTVIDINMRFGYSYDCNKCKKQNFVQLDEEGIEETETICYNCNSIFNINFNTGLVNGKNTNS